jgi:hypothetical protein
MTDPALAPAPPRPELNFDFRNPDYVPIFRARYDRLVKLREIMRTEEGPAYLAGVRHYYKYHPWDFINDWGVTVDPRVAAKDRAAFMPFLLFPRQIELVQWLWAKWRAGDPGLMDKSRDMGASWVAMGFAATMAIFWNNFSAGFGSRKEEYVDKIGDPKSLFYKGRMFMSNIPVEFRGGWLLDKHAPHMRIVIPETGSVITGEAGDNIGRGDRTSIYFVDESAHLERPQLVDMSLSATTDCRIDMSSVNGMANPFAEKRHSWPPERIFTFHWRDDPRKDDAWYAKKCSELDPVTVAQEIDISYAASVEGVVCPALWVQAAIDAHVKLGIKPVGIKRSSLDVADSGRDKNAWGWRHGIVLHHAESWSGKDSDIYATTEKAFNLCDLWGVPGFDYDGDGLGAGVRGDARKINDARREANKKVKLTEARPLLDVRMFRGSAAVMEPEKIVPGTQRTAEDFFSNFKAQAWWLLRFRFYHTWRAVTQGHPFNPDEIISISKDFAERVRLVMELSQPVYALNKAGQIVIDKVPDGMLSPNLADMVMMLYAPRIEPLKVSQDILDRA